MSDISFGGSNEGRLRTQRGTAIVQTVETLEGRQTSEAVSHTAHESKILVDLGSRGDTRLLSNSDGVEK